MVCLRSIDSWNCGFESDRRHGCLYLVSVVCCQRSMSRVDHQYRGVVPSVVWLAQSDLATWTMRRSWPTRAVKPWAGKNIQVMLLLRIGCEASFSHSLNKISLNRNLYLFNKRFVSNSALSVVEELCFTHDCDSDALCVLGYTAMGNKKQYVIKYTADFNIVCTVHHLTICI